MNHEFMDALNEIVESKGIDKDILIDTIEQALLTAYKKNFGQAQNVEVEFNRESGDIKVCAGKPEDFVHKFLDPMNELFLQTVRRSRKKLKDAPEDEPALRGETFMTQAAIEKGLVDGKKSMLETLQYAQELAAKWDAQVSTKKKALNIFNS